MEMSEYLSLSERTEKKFPEGLFLNSLTAELMHHIAGVVTEAGELEDAFKKHVIYGKDIDLTNLKEEIGDVLWYLAGLCRLLNTTFEDEAERNINKLKARYGEKFTEEKALVRDLKTERFILENMNVPNFKVGDKVKVLSHDYGEDVTFPELAEIQEITWIEENSICIDVIGEEHGEKCYLSLAMGTTPSGYVGQDKFIKVVSV